MPIVITLLAAWAAGLTLFARQARIDDARERRLVRYYRRRVYRAGLGLYDEEA